MKNHILHQYKTISQQSEKKGTTTMTFSVENSDRECFAEKTDSTSITEAVETSDRNNFSIE